jgi:HPt (histidine-containing phosphotransfer) domain-containing protein
MWQQFRPQMDERLALLESAATTIATNSLSLEQRSAAASAAHKLAGVLGTFGLAQGTIIARKLEQYYSSAPASTAAPQLQALTVKLRALISNR